jgi:hypothetical protein
VLKLTSQYNLPAKWKALAVHVIPAIMVWTGLGFPIDKAGIGILATALLTGVFDFIKGASDESNKDKPAS